MRAIQSARFISSDLQLFIRNYSTYGVNIYPLFTTSLRNRLVNKNSLSYGVHGNFYLQVKSRQARVTGLRTLESLHLARMRGLASVRLDESKYTMTERLHSHIEMRKCYKYLLLCFCCCCCCCFFLAYWKWNGIVDNSLDIFLTFVHL